MFPKNLKLGDFFYDAIHDEFRLCVIVDAKYTSIFVKWWIDKPGYGFHFFEYWYDLDASITSLEQINLKC